jgi:hypothetical protein
MATPEGAARDNKACLGGCLLLLMATNLCGWSGAIFMFGRLRGWF